MRRRGSALLMALWVIVVLSVMVLSFSVEAKLQAGINVYVRENNRVKRLVDSGRILGEMVLLDYANVKDWMLDEDENELLDEDRWYKEKRDLKGGEGTYGGKCTIGPILLDEENPESGTVTVEISPANSVTQGININEFYQESDVDRWLVILEMLGISENKGRKDFRTKDGKSINLAHHIIAGWMDYRDEDSTCTAIKGEECGAEEKEYEEFYDEHDEEYAEEDRFKPANGPISDIKELARIKVFQEYPAVLTGGVVNPWADEEEQINIPSGGLLGLGIFGVSGGVKFNVNHCNQNLLLSVPGIYVEDEQDEEDGEKSESKAAAEAILACLKIKPQDSQDDEERDFYPYKDFSDMCSRVEDEFPDVDIESQASQYLIFGPEKDMLFTMKITASSMGMKHVAECDCYVDSDKKVRYVRWKE